MLADALCSWAQYDPSFSHYFDMEPSFNPAAVGKQAKLNVTAAYALDMAGFEHNPRTMYVAADMPLYALKNYHGVGINLMNDQIGLFHSSASFLTVFSEATAPGGYAGYRIAGWHDQREV